jgi:hypothetical protein
MRFSKTMCPLILTLLGGLYVNGFGLTPEAAAAQVVDVDEGTFVVELNGRTVGTERFRIRQSGIGSNARTIAQGTLEIVEDGLRQTIQSGISTLGVGMSLDLYDVKVSAPSELSILLERHGDRMVSVTSSEAGVEEREYRQVQARTPTVVLDHFFAHHYFFLTPYQAMGGTNLSVILPRPGGQSTGTLRMIGVEPLPFETATVQAQRLELSLDGAVHEIWLDGQNRVLQVRIRSQGYLAQRVTPPS